MWACFHLAFYYRSSNDPLIATCDANNVLTWMERTALTMCTLAICNWSIYIFICSNWSFNKAMCFICPCRKETAASICQIDCTEQYVISIIIFTTNTNGPTQLESLLKCEIGLNYPCFPWTVVRLDLKNTNIRSKVKYKPLTTYIHTCMHCQVLNCAESLFLLH